jgi:hypothetical protein
MNKPKIDLKARLGRRTGATPASASIPPPVGVNPQHSSAGPAGPASFPSAQFPSTQPQPRPSSYNPMGVGAIQAPPAPMQMASPVNIAMDEEFAAVRRGGRTKVIVLAGAAALIGGVLGFAVGGLNEKNNVAEAAVVGAKTLSAEIDAANATVTKLSSVLDSANKALKDGNYPDNEVKELAAINIPFDGTNLSGKSIGRFKPQLVTMLISYAEATSKANSQKDKIRSLLSGSRQSFEELLAQKTNPQVHWGVSIQQGPQGPWGAMQLLPSFSVNGEKGKPSAWPTEFTLADADKSTAKRYTGGDPTRGADGGQIIPIAPSTQTSVCPTDTIVRMRRELTDMQRILNGDETPGNEAQGIVALGDTIKKQLNSIGG